jgi:hypothetical protein
MPEHDAKNLSSEATELRADDVAVRREAARRMGAATSERKREAVRENGKKGGRPRGSRTSPEAKARMQTAQKRRRVEERQAKGGKDATGGKDARGQSEEG